MERKKFRCCARCRKRYYCDQSCQRVDWPMHRDLCNRLRTLRLSDPMTTRDRSFLRALIHSDYRRFRRDIWLGQLLEMQKLGEHLYVTLDYSKFSEALIDFSPFVGEYGGKHSDLAAQQADFEARARGDGRIELYLVHLAWPPDLVLPLRSADARIQDGLVRISRGLQRDPVTRAIMNEEQALEDLEVLDKLPILMAH
ncbi:hypothetical protein FB451DRAFT_1240242 [Mycena latifolia]|nr:hypothetical protein FB451DRAFT_1240242 [Mycena latifolia]